MDLRAVLLIFASFIALAATGPIRNGRSTPALVKIMMQSIRDQTQAALNLMADTTLSPGDSCSAVNLTGRHCLQEPQPQQVLTVSQLSNFRWHLTEAAKLTPWLAGNLSLISQACYDLQRRMSERVPEAECTVPGYDSDLDKFLHVKCLLQLFERWLSQSSA